MSIQLQLAEQSKKQAEDESEKAQQETAHLTQQLLQMQEEHIKAIEDLKNSQEQQDSSFLSHKPLGQHSKSQYINPNKTYGSPGGRKSTMSRGIGFWKIFKDLKKKAASINQNREK